MQYVKVPVVLLTGSHIDGPKRIHQTTIICFTLFKCISYNNNNNIY